MLKKLFTTKLVIIPITIICILLIVLGILLFLNKYMTPLEKTKIIDDSNEISYAIEEVIERDYSDESHVMFALSYLKQIKGTNTFTLYEVRDAINNHFENVFDEEKLNSIGITPYMVERGVTFDATSLSYTFNKEYTRTDIASMPIVKYNVNKVSKKSKNKYVITYDKYVVTNPYNVYNYYLGKDDKKEELSIISDYLKGNMTYKVKDLVTKDNINDVGSVDGKLKITFKLIDNKLKISKVEKIKK